MFKNLFKGSHTRNEYNSKKENNESYEDKKRQMADAWVTVINAVENIKEIDVASNTLGEVMDWAIFTLFIKKWLFSVESIGRFVTCYTHEYLGSKYDTTLYFNDQRSFGKDRVDSSTAKFERSIQAQVNKINENLKNSNYKPMIKELKTLAKMLKYSKHYIGKHRPLYKYDQVKQAFSGLSDKITSSTKLIEEKIEQISRKYPVE